MRDVPRKFLELSRNQLWKSCIICGKPIRQLRKAFFECDNRHSFIAHEQDMRK